MLSSAKRLPLPMKALCQGMLSSTSAVGFLKLEKELHSEIDKQFSSVQKDFAKVQLRKASDRKSAFKKCIGHHKRLLKDLNSALYDSEGGISANFKPYLETLKKAGDHIEGYIKHVHAEIYARGTLPKVFDCFEEILCFKLTHIQWVMKYGSTQDGLALKEQLEGWINRLGDPRIKSVYFSSYYLSLSKSSYELSVTRDHKGTELNTDFQHPGYLYSKEMLLKALEQLELTPVPIDLNDILYLAQQACKSLETQDLETANRFLVLFNELKRQHILNTPSGSHQVQLQLLKIQEATKIKMCEIALSCLSTLKEDKAINYQIFNKYFKLLSSLSLELAKPFTHDLHKKHRENWESLVRLCSQHPVKLAGKENSLSFEMSRELFQAVQPEFHRVLNENGFSFKVQAQSSSFIVSNVMSYSLEAVQELLAKLDACKRSHEEKIHFKNSLAEQKRAKRVEQGLVHDHFARVLSELNNQFNALGLLEQDESSEESPPFVMSYSPEKKALTGFALSKAQSMRQEKVKTKGAGGAVAALVPVMAVQNDAERYGFDADKYGALTFHELRTRGDLPKTIYVALDNTNPVDDCAPEIRQVYQEHVFSHAKLCSAKGESGFKFNKGDKKELVGKHKSWPYRALPKEHVVNKVGDSLYVYNSLTDTKSGKNKTR